MVELVVVPEVVPLPLEPVVLAAASVDALPVVDPEAPVVVSVEPEVLAVLVEPPVVDPVVPVVVSVDVSAVLAVVSVEVPVEVPELLAVVSVVVPPAELALPPVAEPQTVPGPPIAPEVDSWAIAGRLSASAITAVETRRFFIVVLSAC